MDELTRAEAAKAALGNPSVELALSAMKADVIAQWAGCSAQDTAAREWLWMFYQNALKFEETLKGFIATGRIAEYNREQEKRSKIASMVQGARSWLK